MEKSPGHQKHPEHRIREELVGTSLRVEVDGELIAKSNAVIQVEEDRHSVRYYFPRSDIDMTKLRRSETTSVCPFKGVAHYYTVTTNGKTLQDAAWTYEDPYLEHRALKDRIAFYDDKFREIAVVALV